MINKGCEVNCCFEKGFILNEEHLQTISSMIKERYPDEDLLYKITKSNSYIFQTSDISEIFKEENSNANLINKLNIIINHNDIINFDLCFEKGEDSFLKIVGEDKDKIFLLYNEIKVYVEKEITIVKTFLPSYVLKIICSMLSTILIIGCMIFFFFEMKRTNETINEVLNSSDIIVKLNYLISINQDIYKIGEKDICIFVLMTVAMIFLIFFPSIFDFFWEKKGVLRITDYFLLGKQKNVYDKRIKVKNNIIWSIGIGLIVSIVGGFLVYIFTK